MSATNPTKGQKPFSLPVTNWLTIVTPIHAAATAAWVEKGLQSGSAPVTPPPDPKVIVTAWYHDRPIRNAPEVVLDFLLGTEEFQPSAFKPLWMKRERTLVLMFGRETLKAFRLDVPVAKEWRDVVRAMGQLAGIPPTSLDLMLGNGHLPTTTDTPKSRITFKFSVDPATMTLTGQASYPGEATRWEVIKTGEASSEQRMLSGDGAEAQVSFVCEFEAHYELAFFKGDDKLSTRKFSPHKDWKPRISAPVETPTAFAITEFTLELEEKGMKATGKASCPGAQAWGVVPADKKRALAKGEGDTATFDFVVEFGVTYNLVFKGPEESDIAAKEFSWAKPGKGLKPVLMAK